MIHFSGPLERLSTIAVLSDTDFRDEVASHRMFEAMANERLRPEMPGTEAADKESLREEWDDKEVHLQSS